MKKEETLIINDCSSECSNCGEQCDPSEKRHITNLGYCEETRKKKGCGIEWKYIYSSYNTPNVAETMNRKDLIEIDFNTFYQIKP